MKKFYSQVALVLMVLVFVAEFSVFSCFAANYAVEITSVETGRTIGGMWRSNYYFFHTEEVSVEVTARNNDGIARSATIYVNALDDLNTPFKLCTTNVTLVAGEAKTLYIPIYIPKWAASGSNCHIKVTAKAWPEGLFCPEKANDFCLLPGVPSYLAVGAFSVHGDTHLCSFCIWVDGDFYQSPVAVPLAAGLHVLNVESRHGGFENGVYYIYEFSHWDDGSTSNSRIVSVSQAINSTVTAYYDRHRSLGQLL
jgi:hypothetical protein